MAAAITKIQKIPATECECREEESIYQRLARIKNNVLKTSSQNGPNNQHNQIPLETIETQVSKHKDLALRKFLLHTGTFN